MLTEGQGKALDAIVAGRLAWSTSAELRALGHSPEMLEELEAAGLVERWRFARELTWTLTPLGAWTLGVVIVEVGYKEDARWIASGQASKYSRAFRQRGIYPLAAPDAVIDKTPGPSTSSTPRTRSRSCCSAAWSRSISG